MLDVKYKLRSAYYSLLNNVQYNGSAIPYFADTASVGAAAPYIVFNNISVSNNWDKQRFGFYVIATLDVVSVFDVNDTQGAMQSELIANEVLKILSPSPSTTGPVFDLGADFQNILTEPVNSQSILERNDTDKVYRQVIQLRHTIKQLSHG